MSLLMVRKSAPAHAADAQDAKGDEVIAQKNGYKLVYNTLKDGYWFYTKSGAGWGLTATNKVAAVNEFNRLVDSAKDSAASVDSNAEGAAQDAGVPNDLAFAVGAIENAIEKYSKTFSRYEDNLEEKDFKRYNAIFHAAVNMHRAIQSA